MRRVVRVPLLLFAAVTISAGEPARGAELSLFGGFTSGDYGTGIESDTQATLLRCVTGDRWQGRVEVPWLRVRTTETVVRSGIGPIPKGSGKGQNPGASLSGSSQPPTTSQDSTVEHWTTGIGDVRLGGYVRVLGGGVKVFRLDTGLEVKAPTADEQEYLGTGEWDYRAVVSGEYQFWSASVFGAVGWNALGDPAWVELEDALDLIAGAESEPLFDRLIVSGWLEGNQEVVAGTGNRSALGIGLRSVGRWRWRALATVGLTDAAEDFALAIGLSVGVEPPKTGLGGLRL